jgi:transcriptional regulator with XRE-family HTH domain
MAVFLHYQQFDQTDMRKLLADAFTACQSVGIMPTESFWEYVTRIAGDRQNREIAQSIGVDASAISRWRAGEQPRVKTVIAFARGYGRPAVEALIAAGYLEMADAFSAVEVGKGMGLSEISDEDLWAELQRRWKKRTPPTPDL